MKRRVAFTHHVVVSERHFLFIAPIMTLLARSIGSTLGRQACASGSRIAGIARLPRHANFSTTCAALANTLLFLEHKDGKINPASLVAATAASKIGGDVDGLVVGDKSVDGAADSATKCVVSCQVFVVLYSHFAPFLFLLEFPD